MAITQAQFDQARDAIRDMQEALSELGEIIIIADRAVFQDKEGNAKVSLTGTQKSQLLSEYNSIKTKLVTAFKDLP
ncbi:hypothetical protein LCGC14_0971610 [marine sediment metagenome]|uniref:Uncharacterized protein n=1 Tax=marine sediment metagenome TaxID=412755 RepID=A0A0F9RHX5_9ZZZZ